MKRKKCCQFNLSCFCPKTAHFQCAFQQKMAPKTVFISGRYKKICFLKGKCTFFRISPFFFPLPLPFHPMKNFFGLPRVWPDFLSIFPFSDQFQLHFFKFSHIFSMPSASCSTVAVPPPPPNPPAGSPFLPLADGLAGVLRAVREKSPAVQLGVGAGGGFLAGYLLGKTSKVVAVFVGSTLIILQVAECQGYVKLHKRKLKADLERFGALLDNGDDRINGLVETVRTNGGELIARGDGILVRRNSAGKEFTRLVAENARVLGGFFSGLLVGFGLA